MKSGRKTSHWPVATAPVLAAAIAQAAPEVYSDADGSVSRYIPSRKQSANALCAEYSKGEPICRSGQLFDRDDFRIVLGEETAVHGVVTMAFARQHDLHILSRVAYGPQRILAARNFLHLRHHRLA